MLEILFALIAGIIQGITEFLPISSSGHLVILHDYFGVDFINNLAFDVILHLGTLVALVIFFAADIIKYLRAFFSSFLDWQLKRDVNQRLAWYLFIGTWPAVAVGYFFQSQIVYFFRQTIWVAIMLIVFGIILYLADSLAAKSKNLDQLGWLGALAIGVAQALALIPGVSRSGITIITVLSQKLNRQAAARFSFLLSIPVVFGTGLKEIYDLLNQPVFVWQDWTTLFVGFVAAAGVGYFCIKYFLSFLQAHSLKVFAYYRIILGIILLLLIYFS